MKHKSGETNPGKEGWFKDKGASDDKGNAFCLKCGAWKGSLGLEPNMELYIKHLCDIFDECKRVLREDGTCFINLGDTYWGGGNNRGSSPENLSTKQFSNRGARGQVQNKWDNSYSSKSLCLIPFRFAIEMVNRGWICRNVIIWHKPNAMPSSAKDRFTVDFEYVFYFSKSGKYWFEQQFEEHLTKENRPDGIVRNREFGYNSKFNKLRGYETKNNIQQPQNPQYHGKNINYGEQGRNKRCVWTIPTKPFSGSHFAVYPPELIRTCIKAGCPKNGIVLDPFAGSGTTGEEAVRQGKNYILIELNPEYIKLIEKRLKGIQVKLL